MRSTPRQKSWEINNAIDDFIDSLNQYHGYAIHSVTEWPFDLYESSQADRLLHNHRHQCHVIRADTSVRLIAKRIFRLTGFARAWSIRLCEFDPVVRRTTTVAQSINYRTRNQLIEAYHSGDLKLIPPAST